MTVDDLLRLALGLNDPIRICSLPPGVSEMLNASTSTVKMSQSTLQHIMRDHPDMDVAQLVLVEPAIEEGLLIQDLKKPNSVIVSYQHRYLERRRYKGVLKVAAEGTEIWVSTFHRTKRYQTKQFFKDGKLLKAHDHFD